MKALYIVEPGKVAVREIERPAPARGQVLLRVRMVGFCGSDLNAFRGKNPMQSYPVILGHEIAATVEQVTDGVGDNLPPGMNVTLSPYTSCGKCPACRNSRPNACRDNQTLGVGRDGGITEYITAPHEKIYPAGDLPPKALALVEPLAVGCHTITRGRVTDKDTVAVLGCGAIGLGAVAGAAWRGARVIAVDIDDRKLQIARLAGASETINSAERPLHDELTRLTGDGPQVVVEAIGLPATFRAAVEQVAFTGRVVYVGYAKEPVEYDTKLFVKKELDIMGSRNALDEFPTVIDMLKSGKFPVDEVVTRTVPIARAAAALAQWDAEPAAVTRILVDMDAAG